MWVEIKQPSLWLLYIEFHLQFPLIYLPWRPFRSSCSQIFTAVFRTSCSQMQFRLHHCFLISINLVSTSHSLDVDSPSLLSITVRYLMGKPEAGQVPLAHPLYLISVSIHWLPQVYASVIADSASQCAIDINFVAHSVDKCWIFMSRSSCLLAPSDFGSVLLLSL